LSRALDSHPVLDTIDTPLNLVAAGKAGGAMAEAFMVRYGPRVRERVVARGGHPLPDEESFRAGHEALRIADANRAREETLVVLLSGGASAMLAAPVDGVDLDAKQETARLLMRAGAAIDELNCVRKHLSRIKGGRLAAAAGTTVTLALSDVHAPVADDPSVIGSGPTVADPTSFADAAAIVGNYRLELPASVRDHLAAGLRGAAEETVKADDPRIESSSYTVVGNRQTAVDGARRAAIDLGYDVIVLDEVITGEANRAGEAFVSTALRAASGRRRPVCILGSGETTVTVRGGGCGGRNQEFVLGSVAALDVEPGQSAVIGSAGTDGIDGPTTAAGALADGTTIERARTLGLSPEAALEQNDTFPFFAALQDLIVWGPTGTNVGDLHVLLVD
jgi:glycerate 2-kinase